MKIDKPQKDRTKSQTMADVLLLPEMVVDSAMLRLKFNGTKPENYNVKDLLEAVLERANNIKNGDNDEVIRLIHAQAISLHLMFESALIQAASTKHLEQFRVFSNIALRAQQQSKDALMCLTDELTPKQQVIQQQNNAINQIVNNGPLAPGAANELLTPKEPIHAALDERREDEAITTDTNLEALGKLYRPKES